MTDKPHPKIIAVVGVSSNPGKFGRRIFTDMAAAGYSVYGVNKTGADIEGQIIYKNLSDLPQKPDMVITVVPPQAAEEIVKECIKLGIKEIWMQPGSGSQAAIEKAQKAGIKVIHNACFMVKEGLW